MTPPIVAIVGAGFAGTMTAAQLLASGPPLRVLLIERGPHLGMGVAYGTDDPAHLLNVPAAEMSAWPDDPGHFARWLGDPDAFAPRARYGAYLQEQLPPGVAVVHEEAIGLLPAGDQLQIRLASRATLLVDRVVLAPGHFPPARPAGLPETVAQEPWYVGEPWSPAARAPLPGGTALLVGTGLSAIDLALTLLDAAGAAQVHMVSRRAQLPLAWEPPGDWPAWLDPAQAPTRLSRLLALVRAEVRRAAAQGVSWRAVFEGLRPHAGALWARLPLVERRRFLRHLRPYWDAHRHRMPPATAARVEQLQREGRLAVHAARLVRVDGKRAGLKSRKGELEDLPFDRLVVCTGPEANSRRLRHPLVQDVVGTGLGRPDALYLGLDVTPTGALIDEDGIPGTKVWAVGTLRKGALWETGAVAELRGQARDVARAVRASLQPPPAGRVQGP